MEVIITVGAERKMYQEVKDIKIEPHAIPEWVTLNFIGIYSGVIGSDTIMKEDTLYTISCDKRHVFIIDSKPS